MTDDLRRVMSFQAGRVWNRTRHSAVVDFSTGEETLTDVLLLDTHLAAPGLFRVRKFTRSEESICGADWEGWIFSGLVPGTALRIRVQAKRMFADGAFRYLDKPGQIELLIGQAEEHDAVPLVALYCHFRPNQSPWCCRRRQPQHFRCTIIPAGTVLALMRDGRRPDALKIDDLASACLPWRCLACRCHFNERTGRVWTEDEMPDYARTLLLGERAIPDEVDQMSSVQGPLLPPRVVTLQQPSA